MKTHIKKLCDKWYNKGRADQKEEDNAFFNFEGAWELEKKKVRADAIDECIEKLYEVTPQTVDEKLDMVFVNALRELKEQNERN